MRLGGDTRLTCAACGVVVAVVSAILVLLVLGF
jgi:hypothetical protein